MMATVTNAEQFVHLVRVAEPFRDAKDASRPALMSVYVEPDPDGDGTLAWATDSYHAVRARSITACVERPMLLHGDTVTELLRAAGKMREAHSDGNGGIVVRNGAGTWRTVALRELDCQPPKLARILDGLEAPALTFTTGASTAQLMRNLGRLKPHVATNRYRQPEAVVVAIDAAAGTVSAKLNDTTLTGPLPDIEDVAGDCAPIGVNPAFVANALEAIGGEWGRRATWKVVNPLRAIVIADEPSDGRAVTAMVMPLRLAV